MKRLAVIAAALAIVTLAILSGMVTAGGRDSRFPEGPLALHMVPASTVS